MLNDDKLISVGNTETTTFYILKQFFIRESYFLFLKKKKKIKNITAELCLSRITTFYFLCFKSENLFLNFKTCHDRFLHCADS